MTASLYQECPGCGVRLPASEARPDERYHASAECWQLYGELSAYTLARGDSAFIHQHAVDAYGAQHVGERTRPIGAAFALIGLYFACEQGYSGRQVQRVHMLLAQRSKTWPRFVPPQRAEWLSVLDVMRKPPGEARDAMLRRWSESVWAAWSQEHERVKALAAKVLAE